MRKSTHRCLAATAMLCLVLFLAACGGAAAPAISGPVAAPGSTPLAAPHTVAEEPAPAPLNLSIAAPGLYGGYAGTEQGCYTLYSHQDNSADILYIDYHTWEMNMLDAPAYTADTRGHLAGIRGSAIPVMAGDHLYIFVSGVPHTPGADSSLEVAASVIQLDLDGSDPATLTLPQGAAFESSSVLLWDGAAFYCITQQYDENDAAFNALTKIDFSAMQVSDMRTFPGDENYAIAGLADKGPILHAATRMPPMTDPAFNTAWAGREHRLFTLVPATGEEQELLSWRQDELYDVVNGNMIYFWRPGGQALFSLDADTGTETQMAAGFGPEDPLSSSLQQVGDRLLVQIATNRGATITQYYIDPYTFEVSQPPLKNLGDNVFIFAQTQDYFLVQSGLRWAGRDENTPGGATSRLQVEVPELSLISKADYWAGNPNYIPIKDNVY